MLTIDIPIVRVRLPKQGLDPNALYNQHVGIFLSGLKRQHSQNLNNMMITSAHKSKQGDQLSSEHEDNNKNPAANDEDDGFQEFQQAEARGSKATKNDFLIGHNISIEEIPQESKQPDVSTAN